MASPEAEAIHARFATVRRGIDGAKSLADQRAAGEHFGDLATEPEGVDYEWLDLGGIRVLAIKPHQAQAGAMIEYLHGGGYQVCSVESHRKMVAHIVLRAGIPAISVEYRLTPEHHHPAQVEDTIAVYRWLLEHGLASEHIALAGDSAGGGLALGALHAMRMAHLPFPGAVVAISPWTDLELTGDSLTRCAATDLSVSVPYLRHLRDDFISADKRRDPTVSPLYGEFAGLPPMLLIAGGDEILRDDTTRIVDKARRAGVDVTGYVVDEMQHVFTKAAGAMPEADEAIGWIALFLRSRLGLSPLATSGAGRRGRTVSIDFSLPPEIEEIRERVRDFIDSVVRPGEAEAQRADRSERRSIILQLRRDAREAGLWLPHMPAAWGGMGLGHLELATGTGGSGANVIRSVRTELPSA